MGYLSFLSNIKKTENVYITTIAFVGIILFFSFIEFPLQSMGDWVYVYLLALSIIILSHWSIISPQGNNFSTDSCIYLFSIVFLGLNISLYIVFLVFLYELLFQKIIWWKSFLNFATYNIMIISSYYCFLYLGGEVGAFALTNIFPYVVSMLVYSLINIFIIAIYFSLKQKVNLIEILKSMVGEVLTTYIIVLFLALVLNILLTSQGFLGLFLFVSICLLLSIVFKNYFELYQAVFEKSNKDHLTNLFNHGYFKQQLDETIATSKKSEQIFSVAILDIDDFKKYNDLYGHLQGDKLLKSFGKMLEQECNEKNYIVARYGGEEFALLMPDTDKNEAYRFLNVVRKKINDSYYEGVEVLPYGCLSFSGGVTQSNKSTYNSSDVLSRADQAMYFAKAQGKNSLHIYEDGCTVQKSINYENELHSLEQQLQIFLSKDIYTYRHSKRVYKYAYEFCEEIQLTDNERKDLIMGALIHDIGKLEIPRDIINKKGKLDSYEWEMMKKHVTWGKEILSANKSLASLLPLVELHHERYDGKGYPHALEGEQIPKLARILCIIDSFDAMTTERPYQRTKSFTEAFHELRNCAGKQFDPEYVEPFIAMVNRNYVDKINVEVKLTGTDD